MLSTQASAAAGWQQSILQLTRKGNGDVQCVCLVLVTSWRSTCNAHHALAWRCCVHEYHWSLLCEFGYVTHHASGLDGACNLQELCWITERPTALEARTATLNVDGRRPCWTSSSCSLAGPLVWAEVANPTLVQGSMSVSPGSNPMDHSYSLVYGVRVCGAKCHTAVSSFTPTPHILTQSGSASP